VRTIVAELEALGEPFEVVVVCDGDSDGSYAAAQRIVDPRVRPVAYEDNRGKGYALCFGFIESRGRLVGWLDADLDISPTVIVDAVRRFTDGADTVDAVVGSKRHAASDVSYPVQRRILSLGYQLLVKVLFRVDVRDTQVGAKVFRREMLDTVLPLLLIKRYAFDLEVLAVGAEFGFDRVEEVPVQLTYQFTGTGINSEAVRRMFQDTLAIGYRIHLRHWYVRQYAALQRERGDSGGTGQLISAPRGTLAEIREHHR
jgi:glycosyltransferase involved in cell wall biosynthesis